MMSTLVARSPLPEDIAQYEGKWIAIRGDTVVAAADTLEALAADERVQETDVVYRVPAQDTFFY